MTAHATTKKPATPTTAEQAALARLRLALRGLNAAAQEQAHEFRVLRETMSQLGTAVNDMEAATLDADAKLKVIARTALDSARNASLRD